jgi:hypothetical protein
MWCRTRAISTDSLSLLGVLTMDLFDHSHVTRYSDSSFYDEVCVNCGATDQVPGGWGDLGRPCPSPGKPYKTVREMEHANLQFSAARRGLNGK